VANGTRAGGGARGSAGQGTCATARGRGRHVSGAQSRGARLGWLGSVPVGKKSLVRFGSTPPPPSRWPCRIASDASSLVALSAGWAAVTGYHAVDGGRDGAKPRWRVRIAHALHTSSNSRMHAPKDLKASCQSTSSPFHRGIKREVAIQTSSSNLRYPMPRWGAQQYLTPSRCAGITFTDT
jgi:hypothetical protein